MRSMNEATLIGHVGGDPEYRELSSGVEVANFSLATNERYTGSDGEERESTEWHRIVAFRGLAGVVRKHVRKGQPLLVRGKIRTRDWEDGEGAKRRSREIVLAGPGALLNMLPSGSAVEPEEGAEEPAMEEAAA